MQIAGCQVTPLDHGASNNWLEFILRRGVAPAAMGSPAWLLCHCHDGVTWGRWQGGEWSLGSSYFPDLCPSPSEANVLELRVFCPTIEVLIWRTGNGFLGRAVRDISLGDSMHLPERTAEEWRLLLGTRVCEHRGCFTRLEDGTGAEQAVPVVLQGGPPSSWPRLHVRHYFARDERTGCVRVVMTRLVDFKEV